MRQARPRPTAHGRHMPGIMEIRTIDHSLVFDAKTPWSSINRQDPNSDHAVWGTNTFNLRISFRGLPRPNPAGGGMYRGEAPCQPSSNVEQACRRCVQNVGSVKTSLVIRGAKDDPGIPFDILEERLAQKA